MDEIWKEIEEYPLYEISNYGRIRNIKTGRILHTYTDYKGYQIVTLSKDGTQKTVRVHKLVATAFCEKYYDDLDVTFIDGDRSNLRADNLDWWTRSDVHRRSYIYRGRTQMHKMKPIRCIETGEVFQSIREASELMGISRVSISRSLNRRSYCTKDGYTFEELEWY